MNILSDNHKLRNECLLSSNLVFIGIAETHLVDNQNINLPGYTWYGQNRKNI